MQLEKLSYETQKRLAYALKMYANHVNGAVGELMAASWFLRRGWYVARSLTASGPFDLIVAMRNGIGTEKYLVEVRYLEINSDKTNTHKGLSVEQKKLGVTLCLVWSDGSVDWHRRKTRIGKNGNDTDPNDGTNKQ